MDRKQKFDKQMKISYPGYRDCEFSSLRDAVQCFRTRGASLECRMPDIIMYNVCRHFDGASNFALNHFGAVMGPREGRQGQSYAIPILVTPVGCGGGCCNVWKIAPMFLAASKLPNVSLPKEFWIELDKGNGELVHRETYV